MDSIISKLKRKAEENPTESLLRDTLTHVEELEGSSGQSLVPAWNAVRRDFDLLEAKGLWEKTDEHAKLLATIEPDRSPPNAAVSKDISIVLPPPMSTPFSASLSPTALPLELVEILNHTYFLHVLATDPTKVLPPGKSLLSVMSRPHLRDNQAEDSVPTLRDKVENAVVRAFWDEALESLSSSEPSKQLPRLKHLYQDLLTALTPLLPSRHPIIILLSSPLSPTPSPLLSALNHLREIVVCLRQRCAPARDKYIDKLIRALDDAAPSSSSSVFAAVIVETVKSTLKLTDAMKDDLSQFVLGNMGEAQLRGLVAQEAKQRERTVITDIWRSQGIEQGWKSWLDGLQQTNESDYPDASRKWIFRIVQALGSTSAISCSLPTGTAPLTDQQQEGPLDTSDMPKNLLPPPFFFSCPSLLYIQNYLQALVIAASLRSLTRIPSVKSPNNDLSSTPTPLGGNGEGEDFMERIWVLLRAEIDEEVGAGDTKVVNLADEVLRARRRHHTSLNTAEDDAHLRTAVERTLQSHDPVFLLLHKRLMGALVSRLSRTRQASAPRQGGVPERMQTGRNGERPGKRPRLVIGDLEQGHGASQGRYSEEDLIVKGFEDPVLVKAMGEMVEKIRRYLDWVEETWHDLVERGMLNLTGT